MTNKIEISRELLDRMINALDDEGWHMLADEVHEILAAPAVERQEPVGFRYRANGDWELMEESPFADGRISHKEGGEELQPLYTSPPAPVAVVLPEREHVHSKTLPFRNPAIGDGYISGWNACLDKVKDMNQCS